MPRLFVLNTLLLSLVFAGAAAATPLCTSSTYDNFIAVGFECEIDGATFSNFSFQGIGSSTTDALDPSDITVTPLSGADYVGLNFEGRFESTGTENGPGPAEGNLAVTYRFIYDVDLPGAEFISVTTALTNPNRFSPNPLKFGGVTVGKVVANDGATAITNDVDPDLMETTFLFNPRQTIFIDDMVTLVGGASAEGTTEPVGFVTLESFDNLLTYEVVIPEPGTLSMLGGAGLLLLLLRRRRA